MVFQVYQKLIEITSNMIYIIALLQVITQYMNDLQCKAKVNANANPEEPLRAIDKLCRLKGGGGVRNCRFYLVKRQLREWGEGVKNRRF